MDITDPSTGQPLPDDAIQRILYLTPKVHIYAIPPLTSAKGYTAADWTIRPAIFTPRLRILETAVPVAPTVAAPQFEKVSITILLEDPATGALFAAAPYGHVSVVERCLDSSRFFAVRVVGDGGRKATLGMGFEERSDAFDFGVALQDAGKIAGVEGIGGKGRESVREGKGEAGKSDVKRDYSLKEGETITVNIGGKGRRMKTSTSGDGDDANSTGSLAFLPPPPSAAEVRKEMRGGAGTGARMERDSTGPTAEELGFDDGEFGEFQ